MARDHYDVLGVPRDANPEQIRGAYRRLARRYHPDLNAGVGSRARFHELSAAYEVLHDPAERARYDRATAPGVRAAPERDVPRFIDEDVFGFGGDPRSMRPAWSFSYELRIRAPSFRFPWPW